MAQHKWHKEINAWADGEKVQARYVDRKNNNDDWDIIGFDNVEIADWNDADFEFRIKPQPKEPKYLYVYDDNQTKAIEFSNIEYSPNVEATYIGKIKLEDETSSS